MHKTIISDKSGFILLAHLKEMDLLQKTFGEIIPTKEVLEEFGEELPNWIQVKSPTSKYRQTILETQIDKGESSAIAFALDFPESVIILEHVKKATHERIK